MHYKKIIFGSLRESFISIWKSKSLFSLLLILQIVFFLLLLLVGYRYVTKTSENFRAIEDYISELKLDEASVASNMLQQKSILGDDPLLISRNFKEIVKSFRIYLFYTFILLILFVTANWTLASHISTKQKFSQIVKVFFRIFVVLLFYLSFIFAFFFSLLNVSIMDSMSAISKLVDKYFAFIIFSMALLYFMFISISLLHKTRLQNILQRTLRIGIKKMHYILSVYFINILLLAIPLFLIYLFVEQSLLIIFLSLIALVFMFVFGRIFMIGVIDKLDNQLK